MGSLHKDIIPTGQIKDTRQLMEENIKLVNRKRKPMDMDDTSAPPKHSR